MQQLTCHFRDVEIPVSFPSQISVQVAERAIESSIFSRWLANCERSDNESDSESSLTHNQRLELHGIELQSVDLFGKRGVGFIKLKADCALCNDDDDNPVEQSSSSSPSQHALPGVCFLRGDAVAILVALVCQDGEDSHCSQVHCLLVEQPRIAIGQVACLELPAGMMDNDDMHLAGTAVQELAEECNIYVNKSDHDQLIDLTQLSGHADGIALSPGGSDEHVRLLYLEKTVSSKQLEKLKGKLTGLREHGEFITLRVVPMDEVWKVCHDAKAMLALFLVDKLHREGKLPPVGEGASPLDP
ncbi:hypothetical protein MPSEU_000989900 [Mayamaea pseudoterrestris]|nr:hypothetical protein MPSEU_000989900 [Mayamaea pseudoterrestris]